jgi:hypothetical protein
MAERRIEPIFDRTAIRVYALIVWAYPGRFREQFGREMRLAFEAQVVALTERSGVRALAKLLVRTTLDWIITVPKEHHAMPRHVLSIALLAILAIINVLAFHDLFEEHTVRDYLTLLAFVLFLVQVDFAVVKGKQRLPGRGV